MPKNLHMRLLWMFWPFWAFVATSLMLHLWWALSCTSCILREKLCHRLSLKRVEVNIVSKASSPSVVLSSLVTELGLLKLDGGVVGSLIAWTFGPEWSAPKHITGNLKRVFQPWTRSNAWAPLQVCPIPLVSFMTWLPFEAFLYPWKLTHFPMFQILPSAGESFLCTSYLESDIMWHHGLLLLGVLDVHVLLKRVSH